MPCKMFWVCQAYVSIFSVLLSLSHCVSPLHAYRTCLWKYFLHFALHSPPRCGFLRDYSRGQDPLVRSSASVMHSLDRVFSVPEPASVDKIPFDDRGRARLYIINLTVYRLCPTLVSTKRLCFPFPLPSSLSLTNPAQEPCLPDVRCGRRSIISWYRLRTGQI
jgi:hypothetical protein